MAQRDDSFPTNHGQIAMKLPALAVAAIISVPFSVVDAQCNYCPQPQLVQPGESYYFDSPQRTDVTLPTDNVCLVEGPDKLNGSGVYLRDEVAGDWVLTCSHIMERPRLNARVTCQFQNGQRIAGTIVSLDSVADQAAVKLAVSPRLSGATLRTTELGPGESVWLAGFVPRAGSNGLVQKLIVNQATMVQRVNDNWLVVSTPSIKGMSGGPVFDKTGAVVGNLWGTTSRETTIVCVKKNVSFLRNLFPHLSNLLQRRADRINRNIQQRQQRCPDGSCPPVVIEPLPPIDILPIDPAPIQPLPPFIDPSKSILELTGRVDDLESRMAGLQTQVGEIDTRQQGLIATTDNLMAKIASLESKQQELATTTNNLVTASEAIVNLINERTDPEVLAASLPGIQVNHNGESRGIVKLGESLNLNFTPRQ